MKEKTIMAQRIRELRKAKGLTQAQLGAEVNLKETAIRSYENGLREPNSKAMVALERYFGVNGEYLRGEVDWDIFIRDCDTVSEEKEDFSHFLQVFWPDFNRAPVEHQALAISILSDTMRTISGNLLRPDSPSDLDGAKINRIFQAAFALNPDGLTELDKRAGELTQLEQYRK